MFTYKTDAEITAMTEAERDAYLIAKRKFEAEQVDKKIKEGVEMEVKSAVEIAVKEAVEKATEAQNEVITKLELDAKKQKENPTNTAKEISFKQALAESLAEPTIKAEIDEILASGGKQKGPLKFEVKSAVDISMTNTIEAVGSASHYTLTSNTGLISTLRKRIMKYLTNVSVGSLPIEKPYAMWIEELDEQGNPIFIAEGAAKTQLSVRYEEREKKAKKIAVYGKVTTEMLRYLPQLISYIQNNLMKRMDLKTEDQLFNGDDTGDNLAGLIGYASAFDGGIGLSGGTGLVGQVQDANEYDVIRALALQVENSYGIPSKVFVTTDTIAKMDTDKDSEGRYILPPFKSANGTMVAGIELVPTSALNGTGVDFVGGDLSVINVSFINQVGIQIGLDGNDFTNNKKTILVEQELVQFVSANDTQVLVSGTFAVAKALIEEVVAP